MGSNNKRKQVYMPDNYIKYLQQTGIHARFFEMVGRDCVYLKLIKKPDDIEVVVPLIKEEDEQGSKIPDGNKNNYTKVPVRSAEDIIAAHFSKGKVILSDTPRTQFVPIKDADGKVVGSRVEVTHNYDRHPMKAVISQENPTAKYIGNSAEFTVILPPQKDFTYSHGDLIEFIEDTTVFVYTIQNPPETYKDIFWQVSLKLVRQHPLVNK